MNTLTPEGWQTPDYMTEEKACALLGTRMVSRLVLIGCLKRVSTLEGPAVTLTEKGRAAL
ncbi:hypothetical protein GCM10009569_34730 [Arthrobacter russicus]|uniref:Uncharacterized protein n=1 Tax=Arthrobacter russicus TaxID=172040 RepID=A0ABU1JE34_9MICC|nr:hypothetical protein [Arthrobacter russicus]